jgi:hypothetical protein
MQSKITVEGVFSDSWQRFTQNLNYIYYLFLPGIVLSFLANAFLAPQAFAGAGVFGFRAFYLAAVIAGILLSVFATISLLFFFSTGKKDTWSDWTGYFRILPKYIGISVLQGLMILIGLILFIVPGIYLAVRYAFVSFRVLENPTMKVEELFSSEAKTTEGSRFVIFAITLVAVLVAILVGIVLGFVTAPLSSTAIASLLDSLFEIIVTPFFTLVGVIAYLHLTGRGPAKSGVNTASEEVVSLPAA